MFSYETEDQPLDDRKKSVQRSVLQLIVRPSNSVH